VSAKSVMEIDVTNVETDSGTDSTVAALFDHDSGGRCCWDCGMVVDADTCYPPGSWGDASELAVRCPECWDKHMSPKKAKLQEEAKRHKALGERIRGKRKAIEAAEPKSSNKKKPKSEPKSSNNKKKPKSSNNKKKPKSSNTLSKFQWVNVKWNDGAWYLAYVFMIHVAAGEPPNYDVYFIEDGETYLGVKLGDIRIFPVDAGSFWSTNVAKFVGETFTHDGKGKVRVKGKFTVDEIGTGDNANQYQCTRAAEGRRKKITKWFPVSKVVMTLKKQREQVREK